ncbi:MAG: YolD-like family protein [Bacillus sp. (in: firmicutes)]
MKWTSLMLPEHVSMLREWAEEDRYETKACLDEQQFEDMNRSIAELMELHELAAITYYENRKHRLMIGHIHYHDAYNRKLHIKDQFDDIQYIPLDHIVEVDRFSG